MSDKNLWATNVYNYWYSLIEAFCWKYYQWGNNYWFPFTWSVTTSTTKPNASSYWPWNYYSSSTFIVVTASPYDRSSVQNDNLRWWVTWVVQKDIKKVYLGSSQVRPNLPYLCFTANTAGSTIKLNKVWTPNDVNLEICTDNITRTSYTIWDTITLNNTGDKVYWRTTSETDTWFSKDYNNYYKFSMTWSIAASWDVNYLLNKNSTLTASGWCFSFLFDSCSSLTSTPILPATTLASNCYDRMFRYCSNLETLPKLPALSLVGGCYYQMFAFCSKIKLSTTQTWEYQTPYRIPYEGEGTSSGITMQQMFASTWWTRAWMWTPSINTTYYTSNTVV